MVEAKEPPFDNPKVTSGWRCDEGGSEQFFAFTTKYSQQIADQTQPRTDANYTFLRYADIVLIFAEAANELNGPTKESVDALNDVRTRSNATGKELANFTDKTSLRSAILEERAMELALEGDRRWDLIRWGIYLQAMNALGGMGFDCDNQAATISGLSAITGTSCKNWIPTCATFQQTSAIPDSDS